MPRSETVEFLSKGLGELLSKPRETFMAMAQRGGAFGMSAQVGVPLVYDAD